MSRIFIAMLALAACIALPYDAAGAGQFTEIVGETDEDRFVVVLKAEPGYTTRSGWALHITDHSVVLKEPTSSHLKRGETSFAYRRVREIPVSKEELDAFRRSVMAFDLSELADSYGGPVVDANRRCISFFIGLKSKNVELLSLPYWARLQHQDHKDLSGLTALLKTWRIARNWLDVPGYIDLREKDAAVIRIAEEEGGRSNKAIDSDKE